MKLRDANLQVYEKTPAHILFHGFYFHFLRTHQFFQRGSEGVLAKFIRGNIIKSSVTGNLSAQLRFAAFNISSWARVLSRKLELQYKNYKIILLFSVCVF